jgi:hypothetical protein
MVHFNAGGHETMQWLNPGFCTGQKVWCRQIPLETVYQASNYWMWKRDYRQMSFHRLQSAVFRAMACVQVGENRAIR